MAGQLIGDRYRIIATLGSGNMANTYLAEDLNRPDGPRCVVKRLISHHFDPSLLAAKRQLFAKEAASLKALSGHSQIPSLFDYAEHVDECYLAEEFIEGHSLAGEISRGDRWQPSQVIQFLQDMLSLLMFVHSRGFIHRDLKPSNIMRHQADDQLVLIDFGAATQMPPKQSPFTRRTRANFVVGTPGYMPVEQANGRAQPNSDVYALGMIAIQALTGLSPRVLSDDDQGEWDWRSHANAGDELAAVLSKMVRYHHKQRYQSAAEAFEAVQAIEQPTQQGDRTVVQTALPYAQIDIPDTARDSDDTLSTEIMLPRQIVPKLNPITRLAYLRHFAAVVGAGAIVLLTAMPGSVQSPVGQPEPHPFNPQNLENVGLYKTPIDE